MTSGQVVCKMDTQKLLNVPPHTVAVDTSSGHLSYANFIKRELVQFSKYNVRRALPSVVDGFKPSQRKVMFACFKRKLVSDLKVAQLSGYISEKAAYHHGETSLQGAIIKLAQHFLRGHMPRLL